MVVEAEFVLLDDLEFGEFELAGLEFLAGGGVAPAEAGRSHEAETEDDPAQGLWENRFRPASDEKACQWDTYNGHGNDESVANALLQVAGFAPDEPLGNWMRNANARGAKGFGPLVFSDAPRDAWGERGCHELHDLDKHKSFFFPELPESRKFRLRRKQEAGRGKG
jgi:hypothetical protein